jgi:hypothetical protein
MKSFIAKGWLLRSRELGFPFPLFGFRAVTFRAVTFRAVTSRAVASF